MGDIHPYGGPYFYSFDVVHYFLSTLPGSGPDPLVFTAIAQAESGLDKAVINDTPATGDYSVGLWQINFFGYLYASRVAQFGTPAQLVGGGIQRQAPAAVQIWREQGYGAWTTYTSGAYRQYLSGGITPAGPPQAPGQQTAPIDVTINPPTEDYSDTILAAADQVTAVNQALLDAANALRQLRGATPYG